MSDPHEARNELRRQFEATGLTMNGNARFLGVDTRTLRRWVNDGDEPPRSVVMLLAVMEHYRITPAQALKLGGYEP
jgi:DNA-binding transcriptional regulator YiaG